MTATLPTTIAFKDTTLDIIRRNGQPWLRGPQIEAALGFKSRGDLNQVYERNKDEFTDTETAVVMLVTNGGKQKVRIFSSRGAWLLGMLARTERAKAFRRWVLDVLEAQHQPKLTTVKEHTRRLPDPKPEVEPRGPATGLPYGRYLITVDLDGCIVPIETETVARGTHIMDTDKLYYLQKAIMQIIPRQCGRAA